MPLKKGQALKVLSQKGSWTEVEISAGGGFNFKGWVPTSALKIKGRILSAPAPKVSASTKPPAVRAPAPPASQESMAASTGPRSVRGYVARDRTILRDQPDSGARTVATLSAEQVVDIFNQRQDWLQARTQGELGGTLTGWIQKRDVQWKKADSHSTEPRATTVTKRMPDSSEAADRRLLHMRLSLRAGLGFLMMSQKVESAATAAPPVDVNISGAAVDVGVNYAFWESADTKWTSEAELLYEHGFFFHKTNVSDSTGALIDTQSRKSSIDEIWPRGYFYFRPSGIEGPFRVGAQVGFQYFKFTGDDVSSTTGPLNLFVSQTTMSVTGGASAGYILSKEHQIDVKLSFDAMFLNMVSESPSNQTGTSPSGKLGWAPSLGVTWGPSEHHHFGFLYGLRMQDTSFSGTGSRVGTSNVTDGKGSTTLHQARLFYEYAF